MGLLRRFFFFCSSCQNPIYALGLGFCGWHSSICIDNLARGTQKKINIYTQTKYLAVFVKPQIKSKLVFVFNRSVHSYRWDCRVSSCPKNGANPDCRKNHAVSGAMTASGGACLPCVGFHHQTKLLFLSPIALLPPRQDVPCQGDRKAQGTPEVLLM